MKVGKIIVRTMLLSSALIGLAGFFKLMSAGPLSTSLTDSGRLDRYRGGMACQIGYVGYYRYLAAYQHFAFWLLTGKRHFWSGGFAFFRFATGSYSVRCLGR